MDVDEEFHGQLESTIKSDLPPQQQPEPQLDDVSANTVKQPTSKYDLEFGYNKILGHPAYPWHAIIQKRADGRINAFLHQWVTFEELPEFDLIKSGVFPFPWDEKRIHEAVNDAHKVAEWNDVIAQSMTLPIFIYTPTLFAMLMSSEHAPEEKHWLSPIILSTTALRAYSQVLHVLANDRRLDMARRVDIMRRCAEDLQSRMDLFESVLRQDIQLNALIFSTENFVETVRGEKVFDEEYEMLAKLFASHTYNYIKIMEAAILRMCDLDPRMQPGLTKLLVESALPNPQAELIRPFSDRFTQDWLSHNWQYTNLLYRIRERPQPLVAVANLHADNVRGVNKEGMWFSAREILTVKGKT